MKIWIASDLHLEFGKPFTHPPPADADVLVCAGDITTKGIVPSIQWIAETVSSRTPVIFVAGNHEFWGSSVREAVADGRDYAGRFPNIHFLENEVVEVNDARFLGCTLWTDFRLGGRDPALAMDEAAKMMRDYKRIKYAKQPYQKYKPIHSFRQHQESRRFLTTELANSGDKATVVVTHHAPSIRSIPSGDRGDPMMSAYASSLEPLILDTQPDVWIHGHVHKRNDYRIGNTMILSNPRGYPSENTGFDPGLVVEI
jgi:Icc-related predicted phosphoesterase